MSDAEIDRLRASHQNLAEIVAIDRAIAAQRATAVVALDLIRLRRECVRAAGATWGHQLRGIDDGRV